MNDSRPQGSAPSDGSHPELIRLEPGGTDLRVGGKALGIQWLIDRGYRVPTTAVLVDAAPDRMAIAEALSGAIDPDLRYAVRSSANVEDGGDVSYAGQFASFLDVRGVEGVADAAMDVLMSADAAGVEAYREHQGDARPVTMSVIVEEMVDPVVSGVAFSRNPITSLNEVVIEAVEGSGELLQAEGVTPQRWVQRWGDMIEHPTEPFLPDDLVREIAGVATRLEQDHGDPIDAEWVFDGSDVWWVQVRAISGLDDVTVYSRRIAKEVLPGMIKPLVWSVNVPMVNRAWLDLLEEAVGDLGIEPEDLARSFGYRAYFNMTAFGDVFEVLGMPRDSLELLLGLPAGSDQPGFSPTPSTFRRVPGMLAMGGRLTRYGAVVDRTLPVLTEVYAWFAGRDLGTLTDSELIADIESLRAIGVESARLNVVTPLLANAYGSLLRSQLRRLGIDGTALAIEDVGDAATDPNVVLGELGAAIAARPDVDATSMETLPPDLRSEFEEFLDRFGHFSDSGNDFSIPPWRETPDTIIKVAASHAPSDAPADRLEWGDIEDRLPAWRRPALASLKRTASAYAHRRDVVSSRYTYGYGLFRPYFLEVGRRLTASGALADPDDIWYLTVDEVADTLLAPTDRSDIVSHRREEMESLRDAVMPELVYGDDFVPSPGAPDHHRIWRGTATARGHHRGTARVVAGLGDFDRVEAGDVLVIPFSDVGWTPLFAKAGAVVAESGGMLSHSSIVAREYGIPCVVSVPGALQIPDGAMVTVDGYTGVVDVEEG